MSALFCFVMSSFFFKIFIEQKDPISLRITLGPENFTGPINVEPILDMTVVSFIFIFLINNCAYNNVYKVK